MGLKANYQKFKKHLKSGGLFYSFWRGIKYFIFFIKRQRDRFKQPPKNTIFKEKLKIICSDCGINIFWNNSEVTKGAGLNVGINTLGLWTDSTKADWQVLEKGKDYLKVKVIFRELPLSQIWILQIKDEEITWQIDLEIEEWLHIDEFRIVCLITPYYKSWICDYQQGDFPRLDNNWHSLYLGDRAASIVGVRFSTAGESLPALELGVDDKDLLPFIQNPPLSINANIIGFRLEKKEAYSEGHHYLFSGKIHLFKDAHRLDTKVENLRRAHYEAAVEAKGKVKKSKRRLKVLLVNLPWQRDGRWGVRAGSRWPHIKDDLEEGNYLPFPFFLAYSASLLRKYGFEAYLIDAIAEKITEDKLLDYINVVSPDLLVAEISTPSLNHDLRLLEKIDNKNFQICLCGPDANIREPEFLKHNKFINYCLMGEYEYILLNLVRNIFHNSGLKDVNGLAYRQGDEVMVNPPAGLIDLDTLPWPLREDLPMDKYLDTPGRIPLPSLQMLASRGCPFSCNFCLWPQLMYGGDKYRMRNIIDVVDEMEYLVHKMRFKSIHFDDDTFNIGKERILKFCQEIKKRGLEKIPWAIMARPDLMDKEMLIQMKEAGLAAIKYGVESASQELIDACGKNMDLKKAERMILFSRDLGIKMHLTFTFGLPGETKSTIQKTIEYAFKLKPYSVQFSITTPFPGTAYFKELDEKGLIIDKNWDDYDGNFKSVIKLDSLSNKDLEEARHRAYLTWNTSSSESFSLEDCQKKFKEVYKQGGLIYSLNKSLNYLRKNKIDYLIKRVQDNYLDLLGIFNGTYAFKGPSIVQIDLTDYCNNNCIACWCNSPLLSKERLNKPKDVLPANLVKNLITEISQMGTREIYFSGGGEPFMHPDILDIIEHAKRLGIICSINTNLTLVDEIIIQRLIDLGVEHLTVSIWAGTADIYKRLHSNKSERDFYYIRDMLLCLNSKKILYPYVKIYNVICNINCHQIKQMVDLVLETKSDFVEFTVVDTIPDATDKLILSETQRECVLEQFKQIKERYPENENNQKPKFLNLEHFLRRISNLDARRTEYDSQFIDSIPCYVGWLFTRIMPNGDVNPCLKSHRFPVGNIHQQPFKEIWNSEKQVYFRKKTLRANKDDPFFTLIGNDPNCKIGCYKSCDDIARNLNMHNKIRSLNPSLRMVLKILAGIQRCRK